MSGKQSVWTALSWALWHPWSTWTCSAPVVRPKRLKPANWTEAGAETFGCNGSSINNRFSPTPMKTCKLTWSCHRNIWAQRFVHICHRPGVRWLDLSSNNRFSPTAISKPSCRAEPHVLCVPPYRAICTHMLCTWHCVFMQLNFLCKTKLLPVLRASEHGFFRQASPRATWRNSMDKLPLKLPRHHQSVAIFLQQHLGRPLTDFGAQSQHTSTPSRERRDGIQTTVRVWVIWMKIYTVSLRVIIPVPQSLPRLVQPNRPQTSILKLLIVLQQCGIP